MWYEQEEGDSWFRQGNYGKALKKYTWIEKVPNRNNFSSLILRYKESNFPLENEIIEWF
jgi:hypothetical protein